MMHTSILTRLLIMLFGGLLLGFVLYYLIMTVTFERQKINDIVSALKISDSSDAIETKAFSLTRGSEVFPKGHFLIFDLQK